MTSGRVALACSTPSSPVVATTTQKPAYSSTSRASLRLRGLSSTRSTTGRSLTALPLPRRARAATVASRRARPGRSMPAFSATNAMRPSRRERSCGVRDFAVSTTMGGPSESRSGRSSSMTAKPSTWGMSRSMTTTDGATARTRSAACWPPAHVCTSQPSGSSVLRTSLRARGSSSTTTTLSRGRLLVGARRWQQPGHGREEVLAAHRLDEVLRRPEGEATTSLGLDADDDDGHVGRGRVALERRQDLPPVHPGQVDVEDDRDRVLGPDEVEPLLARGRARRRGARLRAGAARRARPSAGRPR